MGIYQTQCREILRASVSTVRQMVRACRRNLETNYGAHSAESGLFTFDLKGLVAQRDLAMDREALIATTARVHGNICRAITGSVPHALRKCHVKDLRAIADGLRPSP
jgi:hypothetical protein